MDVFGVAARLLDRLAQASDALDFLVSPLAHWERWRATANPVQFYLACFAGLCLAAVAGVWIAERCGLL